MKIPLVGAELFRADRQTHRHNEAYSRFSKFCERTHIGLWRKRRRLYASAEHCSYFKCYSNISFCC